MLCAALVYENITSDSQLMTRLLVIQYYLFFKLNFYLFSRFKTTKTTVACAVPLCYEV